MDMFEFVRWGDDLEKEFAGTSDRGAAIVGAAMLDAQLRVLFEAVLTQEADKTALFETAYAPLQSFSGKTDLALALGIISLREHRNLTLIRRIRNRFAHRIGQVSFETPEIAARCNELDVPLVMRLPEKVPLELLTRDDADPSGLAPAGFETPRQRFQVAVAHVSSCLGARLMEAMGEPRKPRPAFERPSQIIEMTLARSGRIDESVEQLQALAEELKSREKEIQSRLSSASPGAAATTIENLRERIAELEAAVEELRRDPARRMVKELTGPMLQRTVEFVRRWEEWAARRQSSV